jgi:predicted unusual protein kinase regulating ubiquinone biosynthesis (AarF/ABC1/UbiB family)
VPSDPLARLIRLGGMAGGIAGAMVADGARQIVTGRKPKMSDLLLTPANARRVTDELARLRGAAMKVGQLLSMDTGELLPPEMTQILARLRSDAQHMPPAQLLRVLARAWGPDWRARFAAFDLQPVAAASIGQVHRAVLPDGRAVAVKVQYPGVRSSIDSDVSNLGRLIALSGLLPKGLEIAPLLDEARRQLHEEADYLREADCLARFGALLMGVPGVRVPAVHPDFSTTDVLVMDFVDSIPIEALETAPQERRDHVAGLLIELTLRELFEFRLMQTDPNFANYRYHADSGDVVLLDFGATRAFDSETADGFHALMLAGLSGDAAQLRHQAIRVGLFSEAVEPRTQEMILTMMEMVFAELRKASPFDFAANDLARRLRDLGLQMGAEREPVHVPPVDTLFLNRKFAGMFLLATRLRARVDLAGVMEPYLDRR